MPPARPYAPTPFWFLNDRLTEPELLRQIAAMDAAGVGGFVLHPRMGLPRDQGWMSPELLHFLRLACIEARRRGLRVILYDEGMYPSGSSSGQVVAENPAYRCRAFEARPAHHPLRPGETLLTGFRNSAGAYLVVVDRPIPSVIRGLHYTTPDDGGPHSPPSDAEDTPPAADLLNPDAMAAFLRLVHDRYAHALGEFFSDPVTGIFTDEPSLLGRFSPPPGARFEPGTTGLLPHLHRLTGTDFAPLLPALFDPAHPDHAAVRRAYHAAVRMRLEETYYAPMANWCRRHNLDLMGHPEKPDDLALQKYFSVPGQDLVWRWVLPGPTATRGPQSTQCKAASSMAHHLRRPRNSNELAGAYGHELTFDELLWLANHCLVRGQNWLIPHAYYYSQRGPRRDERPPDVGLNAPWAPLLPRFNAYCARLCRLIATAPADIRVALIASGDHAPDAAAQTLLQHQYDFHYLPDALSDASLRPADLAAGYTLADRYTALIHDGVGDPAPFRTHPGFLSAADPDWLSRLHRLLPPTFAHAGPPAPGLRALRLLTQPHPTLFLFNEGLTPLTIHPAVAPLTTEDPWTGQPLPTTPLTLAPGQTALLTVPS